MSVRSLAMAALVVALAAPLAHADEPTASFALLVGVNRSVDPEQPELRYADDDAALYFALFRTLGARTYLLTRPDDNTLRVHAQAVAEATPPTHAALEQALRSLATDVAQARARHVRTVFYFIYAGHGNVRDGHGYIALEDQRLDGVALAKIVDRVGADQAHLVVDACYSFYLAFDRGPGGHTRAFTGLRPLGALAARANVGLLLSTSSARESHEWAGIQAGVFSHEVRSGLLGAADADGDGRVSYREIAAFIERANDAIPNERFRPDVYARAPRSSDELIDLRPAMPRHVELPPGPHYQLESGDGLRLADVHDAFGRPTRLLRPMLHPHLYVRVLPEPGSGAEPQEYLLPATEDVVSLASLQPQPQQAYARGPAHEAFSTLFSRSFDTDAVKHFTFRPLPDDSAQERREVRLFRCRVAGGSLLAGGGAALVSAIGLSLSGALLHAEGTSGESQQAVAARNDAVERRQLAAGVLYGGAAALAVGGTLLLVLPPRLRTHVIAGTRVGLGGTF